MKAAIHSHFDRMMSKADYEQRRFLTSGCCEDTGNVGYEELQRLGLKFKLHPNGDFYPLSEDEELFIAEEFVNLGDNHEFDCLLGYSALLQGRKYLVPTIEIGFDESEDSTLVSKETAKVLNAEARNLAQHIAETTGGCFFWDDDAAEEHENGFGRFVIEILIPFSYAQDVAIGLDTWQAHLKGISKSLRS